LQKQLNSIRLRRGESVLGFSNRIDKAYHDLAIASSEGRSLTTAKSFAEFVKIQALGIFLDGIIPQIRTIIKGRNIKTFEEAVSIALEEEQYYENNQYHFNYNKSSTNSKPNYNNYNNYKTYNKNKSYNKNDSETKPQVKKEYDSRPPKLICNYCKKVGHHVSDCRKLKFNKEKQMQNPSTSKTADIHTVNEIINEDDHVMIAVNLDKDHLNCYSENLINNMGKFLIDSGSDMNLVKISK
jgi:hypothetical protein